MELKFGSIISHSSFDLKNKTTGPAVPVLLEEIADRWIPVDSLMLEYKKRMMYTLKSGTQSEYNVKHEKFIRFHCCVSMCYPRSFLIPQLSCTPKYLPNYKQKT